jgi:diphthine synthase
MARIFEVSVASSGFPNDFKEQFRFYIFHTSPFLSRAHILGKTYSFKFRSSIPFAGRLKCLGEVVFVGLGLHDELGMSLCGLEEVKTADMVFIELYTSLLPDFSISHLEKLTGKRLHVLSRRMLEDENGEAVLEAARRSTVVLLVPGDPLIATTHVALRVEAEKREIRTRVIHGASVLSAVVGLSGLHNYKFGKTVTIPFPDETPSETPYEVIAQNKKLGLHTLCLLDMKAEEKRYLSIHESLELLLKIEGKRKKGAITSDAVAVGIARAGSSDPIVKAGFPEELLDCDFGGFPQSLIFAGHLHFMEAEALIVLCGASEKIRKMAE